MSLFNVLFLLAVGGLAGGIVGFQVARYESTKGLDHYVARLLKGGGK